MNKTDVVSKNDVAKKYQPRTRNFLKDNFLNTCRSTENITYKTRSKDIFNTKTTKNKSKNLSSYDYFFSMCLKHNNNITQNKYKINMQNKIHKENPKKSSNSLLIFGDYNEPSSNKHINMRKIYGKNQENSGQQVNFDKDKSAVLSSFRDIKKEKKAKEKI